MEIISIHAPTRGATKQDFIVPFHYYFNPRSHERSDKESTEKIKDRAISIHAPTRGATALNRTFDVPFDISIHAPTRGATARILRVPYSVNGFQSTLPREERLIATMHKTVV